MNKITSALLGSFLILAIAGRASGTTQLHDPTRPPDASSAELDHEASQSSVDLMAIFGNSVSRYAIISGEIYREGDKIGEFTITQITPYTVVLTSSDQSQQVLELVEKIKTDVSQGASQP